MMYRNETNNIHDFEHLAPDHANVMSWDDPRLARITRLRLLTDPGFDWWDVSYCWGESIDGTRVRVVLPFDQLPKGNVKGAIIEHARRDGVHAKSLGALDDCVLSRLW